MYKNALILNQQDFKKSPETLSDIFQLECDEKKFNEWLGGFIDGTLLVNSLSYTSCEVTVALKRWNSIIRN